MARRRYLPGTVPLFGGASQPPTEYPEEYSTPTPSRTYRRFFRLTPPPGEWQVYAFGKMIWYRPVLTPWKRRWAPTEDGVDQFIRSHRPFVLGAIGVVVTPVFTPIRKPIRIQDGDDDQLFIRSRRPFVGTPGVLPGLPTIGSGMYVEVYDSAGNKLGAGPIFEIEAAQITDRLDQGGDFSLTIAASDERATLAAQGREVRIYRAGEGLIFRGMIEAQQWQVRD